MSEKTSEQLFEDAASNALLTFNHHMRKAHDEALADFYEKALPFVVEDVKFNARNQANDAIRSFLAGYDQKLIDITTYSAEMVRKKLYQENKEEIIRELGKDFEKEIAFLRKLAEEKY